MATLQKIRDKGPLLVVVIGLALFAFIAGDAWKIFRPNQGSRNVGEIYGESIPYIDFQKKVEELSTVRKMQQNATSLTEQQLDAIRGEIWNSYIANNIVTKEAKKLGLTVTDAEVESILKMGTNPMLRNTPFTNPETGIFDYNRLSKFLAEYNGMSGKQVPAQMLEQMQSAHNFWLWIEHSLKESLLFNKYRTLLSNAVITNSIEAETAFADRTNQASMLVAALPFSAVPDSTVKVSTADIKEVYNERKESFYQPAETRDFKYIDVHIRPSQTDRQALNNEVEKSTELLKKKDNYANIIRKSKSSIQFTDLFYAKSAFSTDIAKRIDSVKVGETFPTYYNTSDDSYNTFKVIAQASTADSIQYRMIQVYTQDQTKTKELADSIYKALKGGADFKALAKQYSQDKLAGESQWLTYKSYEKASLNKNLVNFINSITQLKEKEIANINLGTSNIVVQSLDKKVVSPKYKLAIVKRIAKFSSKTFKKAFNKLNSFVASNATLAEVEKNAEKEGYRLLESKNFRSNQSSIGGIQRTKEAVRWTFKAETNDVSNVFKCDNNNHLLVIALENITDAGYRPIKAVAPQLMAQARNNKKAELIMKNIKTKGVQSIQDFKALDNATVDTVKFVTFANPAFISSTRSREIVMGAFNVLDNKTTSPVFKGNGGVYMAMPIDKSKTSDKYDAKEEVNKLSSRNGYMVMNSALQTLYKKAGVVDSRYLFF